MAGYLRWYVPGGTYFFTLVTERRVPLFADADKIDPKSDYRYDSLP